MKRILAIVLASLGFIFVGAGAAHATTPTLPATTSWTNAGLQEMLRISGPITVSVDGAGFTTRTGTIQVDKPANSTVIAAYLTSAVTMDATAPSGVTLEGQAVTFSHTAHSGYFYNYFSDVTSIVQPLIDAAGAGTTSLTIDEGAVAPTTGSNDGEELVVIFNDPAKPVSSVILAFGASQSAGDSFSMNFPALTNMNFQHATLSLGIGFSYQVANRSQQTDVKVSTSSNSSPQWVSQTAGGQDDGQASNGALLTVGGIGDSTDLPALTTTANDDEFYSLDSFLTLGDSSLTFNTRNASADDNVFQAVLYLEGVAVDGAVTVGSAPTVTVPPSNPTSTPTPSASASASATPTATAAAKPVLAQTGASPLVSTGITLLGGLLVAAGIAVYLVSMRKKTK